MDNQYGNYQIPPAVTYPTGKKELIFCLWMGLGSLILANFVFAGGFNLGFAMASLAILGGTVWYLWHAGWKGSAYSRSLLGLSAVILLGFARSDDGFVKFVMICFLFVSVNLGLALTAAKNRWDSAGVYSLLDPFAVFFGLGMGKSGAAFRGLKGALRDNSISRAVLSLLLGLAIAVPMLLILIPLLISADAAFDGLMGLLPAFNFQEIIFTVVFGIAALWIVYSRGTALNHAQDWGPVTKKPRKGLAALTMNTALGAVCLLYVVYLFSQLAYFVGGFAGILPEGFTAAAYARRGFFEMAWLCVLNLSIMIFGVSMSRKNQGQAPLVSRIMCLFIGLVTLFFVIAAGAKMGLYIGSFGLTRLRLLTMVIMVFLGLTTAVISLWLFMPKLPYMKTVLLIALVMGAVTLWVDVDTQVANYNVSAYLSGRLETVDVGYLEDLGGGAVPALDRLARQAPEAQTRKHAAAALENRRKPDMDLRGYNFTRNHAWNIAEEYALK